MKKIVTTTIAAGLIAGAAAAEVSTTFDFASAYVFRLKPPVLACLRRMVRLPSVHGVTMT